MTSDKQRISNFWITKKKFKIFSSHWLTQTFNSNIENIQRLSVIFCSIRFDSMSISVSVSIPASFREHSLLQDWFQYPKYNFLYFLNFKFLLCSEKESLRQKIWFITSIVGYMSRIKNHHVFHWAVLENLLHLLSWCSTHSYFYQSKTIQVVSGK